MRTIVKHILLITAALSLVSCRKDTVTEKWVLAEYTCKSDRLDQRFTYQYDAQGRLVQVKEETKGLPTVHVVYTYERNTITRYLLGDPMDLENWASKIVYTLDNSGKVVKSVDELLGQAQIYSYSADGFLEKVSDGDGNVTQYSWKNNSLDKMMHADGTTVQYTYSNNESMGLLCVNISEKGDNNLAHLGYFGKNSRLLPAKMKDITSDGKAALTVEYNYTAFDANARLTGYTQTTMLSAGSLEAQSVNTYKLTWKPLQ